MEISAEAQEHFWKSVSKTGFEAGVVEQEHV